MNQGLETRSLGDFRESGENPRQITDERYEALKYALKKDPDMLKARPIIATPDGEVVCGNMRLRALNDLGWTEAPVYVADLSPTQKREWMLRDNQEYGDWVPDELAALIARHRSEEADMKLLGFADPQLESLLKSYDDDAAAAGGTGNGGEGNVTPEVWGLVVECESESQQAELAEELADRGLEVRALIPD